MRRILFLATTTLVLGVTVLSPSARAADSQIQDPAGDHPVPWMDLTAVNLAVSAPRGGPALDVTFELAGEITDPTRNTMTGYIFRAKAGSCKLTVLWYAYPMGTDPSGAGVLPIGSGWAQCEGGRELDPPFKISGNTITLTVGLRDLKGVAPGTVVSEMTAVTSPGEGFAGSDTAFLATAGDAAAGEKPWTLG